MHRPVPQELNRNNLLRVYSLLEGIGVVPFFGTLLGLVREGDILPNDDDVDFLLERKNARLAIKIMKASGYKLRSYRGCFMQFKHVVGDVKTYIDFYLYEVDAGRDMLIEKWNFFGRPDDPSRHIHIPRRMVFPLVGHMFFEREIMLPACPEACCEYLYGERWLLPASKVGRQYVATIKDNRPRIIYEGEPEFDAVKSIRRQRKTLLTRIKKFNPITRARYFLETL